ncbi:MAG: hypothetical protein JSW39_19095 [Desulfobacterales bacterium]|nr:MAG: hypothetical protein JSW39_19095 [Desulfobacterales bacterium]
MSIRLIARDLYRLHRQVGQLENKIAHAPPERIEELKDQLRKVKAERERLRNALEGRKESSRRSRPW